jgi:hypothetical protein
MTRTKAKNSNELNTSYVSQVQPAVSKANESLQVLGVLYGGYKSRATKPSLVDSLTY